MNSISEETQGTALTATTELAVLTSVFTETQMYLPGLYRSDDIAQDTPVQQYFANHYRTPAYHFILSSPLEDALEQLNMSIEANLEAYTADFNNGNPAMKNNLLNIASASVFCDSSSGCSEHKCTISIIRIIIENTERAISQLKTKLSLLECEEPTKYKDTLIEEYEKLMGTIVALEEKLPALSAIISQKLDENGFPLSIWKIIFNRIKVSLIEPAYPILSQVILNIFQSLRNNSQLSSEESFELACSAKRVCQIITDASIDEHSVHYIASSKYKPQNLLGDLDQQCRRTIKEIYESLLKKPGTNLKVIQKMLGKEVKAWKRGVIPALAQNIQEEAKLILSAYLAFPGMELDPLLQETCKSVLLQDYAVEVYLKRLGVC